MQQKNCEDVMLRSILPGVAVLLALCILSGIFTGAKKHATAVAEAGGSQQITASDHCIAFSCRHREQIQIALEQD